MKKIGAGAWTFNRYPNELYPIWSDVGFDGMGIDCYKPYGLHPDQYDTEEKRDVLRHAVRDNGLEIAEFGVDAVSENVITHPDRWCQLILDGLSYADKLGLCKTIRLCTGEAPVLPLGIEYDQVKENITNSFRIIAKRAKEYGMRIVWEFEPGLVVNEPKNIIQITKDVNEENFQLVFDVSHGYTCAKGETHIEKGCALKGGIDEFLDMAKGMIGRVHLIDTDGSLVDCGLDITSKGEDPHTLICSKHMMFGKGILDFDHLVEKLICECGYSDEWWIIDMECHSTDEAKAYLDFVQNINNKWKE